MISAAEQNTPGNFGLTGGVLVNNIAAFQLLFVNAASIKRILCPATNAFDRIDDIVGAVKEVWNGELILLALGPTATVLAAEFSALGMQALDVGHVDIEYEWFLRGAKGHDQIDGKFTNEASGGNIVAECDDTEYHQQIVCRVI